RFALSLKECRAARRPACGVEHPEHAAGIWPEVVAGDEHPAPGPRRGLVSLIGLDGRADQDALRSDDNGQTWTMGQPEARSDLHRQPVHPYPPNRWPDEELPRVPGECRR